MNLSAKAVSVLLGIILLSGATLRLYDLSSGDMLNDEVAYGLRAIGLVDSFNDPRIQSTPLDWFDPNIPWWTSLSYHDHPPLIFLTQYAFTRTFGETIWSIRLASALFGLGSALLIFAITRRLFGSRAALIAAAIAALDVNQVFVSRVGLQESELIFFLLLTTLLFLKAIEKPRLFLGAGFTFGLALLTKYSAIVMAPVFLIWLLIFARNRFRRWEVWGGILAALIVFSPVIIYNIQMYRAVGHFDLQFSYVFGQNPEIWSDSPGKKIGTIWDRVENLIPALVSGNAWPVLLLFGAASLFFCRRLYKNRKLRAAESFIFLWSAAILGYLIMAGAAPRFVTMLGAPMIMAVAGFLEGIRFSVRPTLLWIAGVALFLAFELGYTINNQILPYPAGPVPWLASDLRFQTYRWGYAEVDEYLDRELAGKYPAFFFETKYSFIRAIQEKNLAIARMSGLRPYPALILYDGNYELPAEVWLFDRRLLYHGWPIADFNEFGRESSDASGNVLIPQNFQTVYLVFQTNRVPAPAAYALIRKAASRLVIKNKRGDDAFEIYEINN